jgi:glycosyltransferase involved in cell wall biosynthesis
VDPRVQRIDLAVGPPGQPTPRSALLGALPRIRRVVAGAGADLVVGFMHSMYVPMAIALWGAGVPLVASEHTGMQHFNGRLIERLLVRMLSRRFVAKTVPSEVVRLQCAAVDVCPVEVLANPLLLEPFELGLRQVPREPPVLLSVGRFMKEKNQLEVIDAFALLATDFPQWTLRFAGDGEMRPQLEQRVAELGLAGRVEMPGAVSAMADEYAAASIVAMPSRWESFGLATAEALASARPVIGFADCPGTNELVRNEFNGILVEGSDSRVRHLEAGLRRLMSDAALRAELGSRGPASVAHFGGEAVTPLWEAFFSRYAAATA